MYGFRVNAKKAGAFDAIRRHILDMDDFVLGWYASYGIILFVVFAKESDAVAFKMRLPIDILETLEPLTVDQSNTLIASDAIIKASFRSFALE